MAQVYQDHSCIEMAKLLQLHKNSELVAYYFIDYKTRRNNKKLDLDHLKEICMDHTLKQTETKPQKI
jgi:hypothetical protein